MANFAAMLLMALGGSVALWLGIINLARGDVSAGAYCIAVTFLVFCMSIPTAVAIGRNISRTE